jgi:pimeloyl-ACP methyl ester carboxylesterase
MVGLSYGTQLGAQYAQLFPNNIRTLVLDAILQHSQSEASNLLIESTAYNLALSNFFAFAGTDDASPLKGQDVEKFWFSLLSNASSNPIPAKQCGGIKEGDCATEVTAEDILFNAQELLVFASPSLELKGSWGQLASAIVNASQGDASGLSTRFDDAVPISGLAIECLDWTHDSSLTLAGVQAKKHMAETFSPITQGATQTWTIQHACLGWPVSTKNPPNKLDIDTPNTILMVSSTADPSSGHTWTVGMLEEIRNKSLVVRKGDGHTSLLLGGDTTKIILEYLLTGVAPVDGTVTES